MLKKKMAKINNINITAERINNAPPKLIEIITCHSKICFSSYSIDGKGNSDCKSHGCCNNYQ
jgi:hypothetical protein